MINKTSMENLLKSFKIRPNTWPSTEKSLFEDPVRNGLFLIQILQEMSLFPSKKPHDPAKSITECRWNLLTALQLLTKTPDKKNTLLQAIVESILKGNMLFFEKLLLYIEKDQNPQVFPRFPTDFDVFLEEISPLFMKYSLNSSERAENMINWLRELGLYSPNIVSWDQVAQDLLKGDLLFRIYGYFMNKKIVPIHKSPRNEASCLANLRKFFEFLRKNKKFPQKSLWMELEIVKGDKEILINLLEDLRIGFEDTVSPEKTQIRLKENAETDENKLEQLKIFQGRRQEISERYNEKLREKMHCLLSEKREIPKSKQNKKIFEENNVFVSPKNELEVLKWLEKLGFSKIVEELKEKNDFWLEFQDG